MRQVIKASRIFNNLWLTLIINHWSHPSSCLEGAEWYYEGQMKVYLFFLVDFSRSRFCRAWPFSCFSLVLGRLFLVCPEIKKKMAIRKKNMYESKDHVPQFCVPKLTKHVHWSNNFLMNETSFPSKGIRSKCKNVIGNFSCFFPSFLAQPW